MAAAVKRSSLMHVLLHVLPRIKVDIVYKALGKQSCIILTTLLTSSEIDILSLDQVLWLYWQRARQRQQKHHPEIKVHLFSVPMRQLQIYKAIVVLAVGDEIRFNLVEDNLMDILENLPVTAYLRRTKLQLRRQRHHRKKFQESQTPRRPQSLLGSNRLFLSHNYTLP